MSLLQHTRYINGRMILKVTGWLLLIEAAFLLIPTAVGLAYGEYDGMVFGCVAAFTAMVGLAMRAIKSNHSNMGRREGFLLTSSVWIWFSMFGMLPFVLGTPHYSVSDAFFEAMSGFTTTGATITEDHMYLPHCMNLWRALMQWIGGMGIILFTLAVIPMLNSAGGMQMFNAEVTGITHDKVRPRISSTAKALWGTYIGLTVALIALLLLGPMDAFDSVVYAFSSISTGGFSTTQTSLLDYNSDYVYIVLMIFMFLGGINFSLIFAAFTGKPKDVWRNEIFRVYVYTVLGFWALLVINILCQQPLNQLGWQDLTVYPMFQVITTITSTGHDTGHFVWWSSFAISMTMLMLFSGSCAGSTSGGAKLDRIVVLFKNLNNELKRCVHPNAIMSVKIGGKIRPRPVVDKVVAFMCIYVLVITFGGVALTVMGIPLVDAFFSSFSCVSNTGLGAGVTGYGTSFAIIPDLGKWILSAQMLIGRLEIFTVLIIFTRPFWRK